MTPRSFKGKVHRIPLRMPEELFDRIQKHLESMSGLTSFNTWAIQCLNEAVSKYEKKNKP